MCSFTVSFSCIAAAPAGRRFDPRVADVRADPTGRARASDQAEDDGRVALDLHVIDLDAGRRAVPFAVRPPGGAPARGRFQSGDVAPDVRLQLRPRPRLLADGDADPVGGVDRQGAIGIAPALGVERALIGGNDFAPDALHRIGADQKSRPQQRDRQQPTPPHGGDPITADRAVAPVSRIRARGATAPRRPARVRGRAGRCHRRCPCSPG